MKKHLVIPILFLFFQHLSAQPETAEAVLKRYTLMQKWLLVRTTAQFTNIITQNALDRDSVQLIACRVSGTPFLNAYADESGVNHSPLGNELINAGRIIEVIQLLKNVEGEERLQLLIKLAIWWLHKAGDQKSDLERANRYIQEALVLSSSILNNKQRNECLFLLGEYYRQTGNETESIKIYLQILSLARQEGNKKNTAYVLHRLGTLTDRIDSLDVQYLDSSLFLYKQLQLEEQEIEVLWDLVNYHIRSDIIQTEKYLINILDIQKSIRFEHSLFADYLLAFAYAQQSNFKEVSQTNAAFENMKWSGMSALEGAFCMRMGIVYLGFDKMEEGESWLRKSIEHRSQETHIYWFKGFLYLATSLANELNRPEESLALIKEVEIKFPPITLWEKAQVLSVKADCYKKMNDYKLADATYMSFLKLMNENPQIDPLGELSGSCLGIADFYISKSNIASARLFMEKAMSGPKNQDRDEYLINYLLFRLDSISGNYKSALNHYIQYKILDDTNRSVEHRKAFDEMTIKYGAEKKDNDIKLLQKEKQLQGSKLLQANYTRNLILAAVALLLAIVGLLWRNSMLKQRANERLETQREEIEKQNSRLNNLVTEKDWLVKEIHHRVKNNLQIVMSLLNSQSAFIDNDVALTAIHDSQHRVHAMSLIHQKLYNTDNVSTIDISLYIHELVSYLADSFNTGQRIRFDLQIEPFEFDVSQAVPLGIILNEAITNSIKYAFPDDKNGVISISFSGTGDDHCLLIISDNGIGMPPRATEKKPGSLGMSLMAGLSQDLEGEMDINNNNGTTVRINFIHDRNMKHNDTVTASAASTF